MCIRDRKEVEWEFSDEEEAAIYDMRLGMEKTFMFGVKRSIYDSRKKETVMLTGGIWWQAGKQYEFDPNAELTPVSYTHLDVYKRQVIRSPFHSSTESFSSSIIYPSFFNSFCRADILSVSLIRRLCSPVNRNGIFIMAHVTTSVCARSG